MKHFPSLDGSRAIAAWFVMIYHFEHLVFRDFLDQSLLYSYAPFRNLGGLGVVFFFVLSGFLLTSILLREIKKKGSISYVSFQKKRALRILPLYYFSVLLTLASGLLLGDLSTDKSFWIERLLLYVFYLPNLAFVLFSAGGFPTQLWSVGSGIQFYLIWPMILKLCKEKYASVFFLFIACFVSFKLLLSYLVEVGLVVEFIDGVDSYKTALAYLRFCQLDCLAVGGVIALLVAREDQYLKLKAFLYGRKVQLINLFLIVTLFLLGVGGGLFDHLLFSVLFGILIMNLATGPKPVFTLEGRVLNFSGCISYGLYVYHPLVLVFMAHYYQSSELDFLYVPTLIIFISLTYLISYASWRWLEQPFLSFKKKIS